MNNLTVPQWTCLKGDMKNWFLYNVQKPFMMSPWVPESCGKKFYSFIFPCYLGCFWRGKGMKKTSIHDLDLIDWRKKQLTLGQQPVFFSGAAIFERLDYRLQELVLKVESQGEKNPGGRIVCVKFLMFWASACQKSPDITCECHFFVGNVGAWNTGLVKAPRVCVFLFHPAESRRYWMKQWWAGC